MALLLLLLASQTPARADDDECAKDVFIYIDVSTTMREERNGRVLLADFAGAVQGLLTSRMINPPDFVELNLFADKVTTARTKPATTESAQSVLDLLASLSQQNAPYVALTTAPNLDPRYTNMLSVVNSIAARLKPGRRQYLIIASDVVHDLHDISWPPNITDDPDPSRAADVAAMKASLTEVVTTATRYGNRVSLIILTPPRDQVRSPKVQDAVLDALNSAFNVKKIVTYGNTFNDLSAIRTEFSQDPVVTIAPTAAYKPGTLDIAIANPNPFNIVLEQLRVLDAATKTTIYAKPANTEIPCGPSYIHTIDNLPQTPDLSVVDIAAKFDVVLEDKLLRGVAMERVRITPRNGRYFARWLREGDYVLDVDIDQVLASDKDLVVTIGNRTERFRLHHERTGRRVVIAVKLDADTLAKARQKDKVLVRFEIEDDGKTALAGATEAAEAKDEWSFPDEPPLITTLGRWTLETMAAFCILVQFFIFWRMFRRFRFGPVLRLGLVVAIAAMTWPRAFWTDYIPVGTWLPALYWGATSATILGMTTWTTFVNIVWPFWERDQLLSLERALFRRRLASITICVSTLGGMSVVVAFRYWYAFATPMLERN